MVSRPVSVSVATRYHVTIMPGWTETIMKLFARNDGPLIVKEHPTGARRTTEKSFLFGLVRWSVSEEEMSADIVYGGAGYVDSETITYWKRRA